MCKTFRILVIVAVLTQLLPGCQKEVTYTNLQSQPGDLQIAVFSDAHYYDTALGNTGPAFERYVNSQGKLIGQCEAVTLSLIQTLKNSPATIILVTGDMTKDGEAYNHLRMAGYFAELEQAGKRVFVVPGNHDIDNPNSLSYENDTSQPIANIGAHGYNGFDSIYAQFGYREAIYRDSQSLSYVAVLDSNTWLIAMDGCIYQPNGPAYTEGKFSWNTYQWIRQRLIEARTKNIRVLGMIHHGMLEHFWGQDAAWPGFLLDNWQQISPDLASLGMNVVFTGHFHAQDIVRFQSNGDFMFDVETGSLVNYPLPYRLMTYTKSNKLRIHTGHVTSIPGYADIQAYEKNGTLSWLEMVAMSVVGQDPAAKNYVSMIAQTTAAGYVAHYHGDEYLDAATQVVADTLFYQGGDVATYGNTILNLYTDLPTPDQNVELDLSTGKFKPL